MAILAQSSLGSMRLNAARLHYHNQVGYVTIGGTRREDNVRRLPDRGYQLEIRENVNSTPNTATMRVWGFTPTFGQEVKIYTGAPVVTELRFGGTIQKVSQVYEENQNNVAYDLDLVDYTQLLDSKLVFKSYQNVSATTVAKDIISSFTSGFTANKVQTNLAPVSIDFLGVPPSKALLQLCQAIGAHYKIGYDKDLRLATTSTVGLPDPATVTNANALNDSPLTQVTDGSQVRTRVYVIGAGSKTAGIAQVGDTTIPILDSSFFASSGLACIGAQRLFYTGVIPGGTGSLVGTGVSPTSAPMATPYVGSGVDTGVHGYAFTFVTAGGETLPSPTVNVTTGGGVPDPTTAPTIANAGSADLWGNGGGIIWQFSYSYSTGASNGDYTALTKVSPDSNQLTPNGTEINFSCPYSTDPGVTFIAIWFKRFDLGQGYHSDTSPAGRFVVANNSAGGTLSVTLSASGVSGNQNAPTSNTTATCNHVGLTSVSIGPVGVTSRKVYRTTAGGAQLKLVATIADNTTTTYTDSTADSGLGANVPTSDTSGLTQGAGQVVAGSTTIPVASVTAFVAALSGQTSGWAVIGNGQQFIKFTGTSGNTLTGVPASGIGAITATISYNSAITAAAQLTGIPTVGPTAISVTIPAGENARPCAQVDDVNAQATLAGYGFGDGVVEDKIDDASLTSYAAMNAAGNAFLSLFKAVDVQINPFASVDYKLVPGATVPVSIGAPTNINISALIQTVTTTRLSMPGTADSNGTIPFVYPLKTAQAGTARLTLAELLAQLALH